ncbi:MAG: putative ATP-dependent RNA helicase [Satyrvirus sp.]|uniref:Putative ATP-dependent RNA helicase n=1 Tax=Satyrvirus sp. TaxID=2487771 RepID=A0A3G5AJ47_9VIRU|nr:MAG: putative ATP-dependent RNA helicase [Satyrvirus sp.]
MIELKEHQKIPIGFMKYNRGLILYHSTGSGKTFTALFAMNQFKNDIIIVGTKSSKKTFVDSISKAEMEPSKFTFYTYTKIKKILETDITIFKNKSVIVDEAHNLRSENMYNLYIASSLIFASKILLLTATPVVNYMNDLSVLVNIVHGEDVLPTDRKLFDQMFYDDEKMVIINENILFDKIKNTISYYKITDDKDYPTNTVFYNDVEMSHEQINEYIYYVRKIIYEDKDIVNDADILNIDYGLLPNKKRNFFLNVTRQLSNTINNSYDSPKIKEIFKKIKKGPHPIIIYSNYLKNGLYTVAILLEINKISYKTITGGTSDDKRNIIVNNYNNGLYKVLLLSSAGSESFDFKNTRQIHIMEPHWNESKIKQVIGRAIRYKSHESLPKNERHVDIYRWISTFPKPIKNASADQYLMQISKKKDENMNKYQEIIVRASIENNFMKRDTQKRNNKNYYKKYLKYEYKLRKEMKRIMPHNKKMAGNY